MVSEIRVEERISKANKPYFVLVLKFESGYICELFINNEKAYCLKNAIGE